MADFKTFPNSGSIHNRQKKSDKAPDMGGDFTLDGEVLDYVVQQASRGQPVKLEISAWNRMGRNNARFISISVNTPYEVRGGNRGEAAGQRRGYSGGGNYGSGDTRSSNYNTGEAGGRGYDNRGHDGDYNRGSGQQSNDRFSRGGNQDFQGQGRGDFRQSSAQRPFDTRDDPRFNGDEYLGNGAGKADRSTQAPRDKWDRD